MGRQFFKNLKTEAPRRGVKILFLLKNAACIGACYFYTLEWSRSVSAGAGEPPCFGLAPLCVIGYKVGVLIVFLVFQPHFTAQTS